MSIIRYSDNVCYGSFFLAAGAVLMEVIKWFAVGWGGVISCDDSILTLLSG